MRRLLALSLLASGLLCVEAAAQPGEVGPSYSRRRGGEHRAPRYYPAPQQGAVAAGAFQRPYPYHLDYYKQRYGGSYEPYFGNLYGPPNVVLGAPYGYYGPYAYGAPYSAASPQAAPQPQTLICPHCQQPMYLVAPADQALPGPKN